MSHLRAPAARADRREGGRHGRPVAPRTAATETHIRPHLMRLAVLPPTAVALGACAVVLFTVRATGVRLGPTLWAVLAGAVAVTGAGIGVAAVAAGRLARSVTDRLDALRRAAARGEADLRALVEALRRGEAPPQRRSRGLPPADADEFELLAADLARAHDGAVAAVVQATQLSSRTGSEQKLEVFLNLARRLQSLVHREILLLDELENEIEDPDLLKGLFHVDHLATRVRRHAENLAVLGGAVSRRQWSHPVAMTEVLRSAIAEVEQYSRVKLVPPVDGELRGHAVADVIHLLAELVENATVFSAPHTQVLLRANLVTSGLAVEVEDRGLGMPPEEQVRMNALLADPDQVNVGRLLADGRIGLFVVSQLARRHGIRVRLQSNIYGGVQAILVVPQALLGSAGGRGESGGAAGGTKAAGGSGSSRTTVPAPPAESGPAGVVPPLGGTPPHGTGMPRRSAPRHAGPRASTADGTRSGGATGAHRFDGTRPGGHAVDHSDDLNGALPSGEAVLNGYAETPADGYATGGTRRIDGTGADGRARGAALPRPQGADGPVTSGAPRPNGRPIPDGSGAPRVDRVHAGAAQGGTPRVGDTRAGGVVPGLGGADGPAGSGVTAHSLDDGVGTAATTRLDAHGPVGNTAPDPHSPPSTATDGAHRADSTHLGGAALGQDPDTPAPLDGVGLIGSAHSDDPASAYSSGAPLGQAGGPGPDASGSLNGVRPVGSARSGGAAPGHGGGPQPDAPAHPGDPAPHDAVRPAPLPMRNPREERANPAEARPGIKVGDRAVVEERQGEVPVPRVVGAVRGTMEKPRLPRRRAQEHLAPQLRGGPVARPENGEPGGHDPGLMAAFQRGMGLAEAQLGLEEDPDHSLTNAPVAPTRPQH
ncbi:MAG TPA: ATP-binding protein, partial [Streptomyces sp.]